MNDTKMLIPSEHHTNMTTFEQSNTPNDASQYSPSFNDANSIDSNDIWNTSIQSNDDNNNNSLLTEENISQYSGTDSNASSPYRMSESDLREIYDRMLKFSASSDYYFVFD